MNSVENDELYHYGVLGMKWGVHRAARKTSSNEKLRKKALNYDIKSDRLRKKSERIHSNDDLDGSNRAAKKAANYSIKSGKLQKKALRETDEAKRLALEKKSAKLDYKSTKQQLRADRLSKSAAYSNRAMRYAIKSDRMARKAAKARMTIANNEAYIAKMNRRMSEVPETEMKSGQEYVNGVLNQPDS